MRDLLSDLTYTLRQLRRSPTFALTTILTLTMAIAANVVVFGIVNALVLNPLPFPQPRQLFQVEGHGLTLSYPDYRDLRDRNRTFSDLTVSRIVRTAIAADGIAQPVFGYEASGNYFRALGVQPLLGQFFGPDDDVAINAGPVAVLSYACWQIRFHADPAIIGRTIQVSKHPYTVVAVAPRNFIGVERFFWPEIWIPFHNGPQIEGYNNLESRNNRGAFVVGRLLPGVSVNQAQADLTRIAAQLSSQYPNEDKGITFRLTHPGFLGDNLGKPVRAFLSAVMAMAFLVLLAACANLAALFASRMTDRARELGIRLAIGSTRLRILRQLVTESTLIALIGGAIATALSLSVLRALTHWRPPFELPVQFLVEPDLTVFLFAALLALTTGLLFGLLPARQIWRTDPNQTLKSSGSSSASPRSLFRSTLLTLQIALCCVLITASLVSVRGMQRTFNMPFGFEPQGVTLATLDLNAAGYTGPQLAVIQQRLLTAVSALPGVTSAALANTTPLSVNGSSMDVYAPGTTTFDPAHVLANAAYFKVSPTYFATAGTALLAGRAFTSADSPQSPRVVIINQSLARKFFSTLDVIGKRYPTDPGKEVEVVGLVEDGKYSTLVEDHLPALFLPMQQRPDGGIVLLIRTQTTSPETTAALRSAIAHVDSSLPVFAVAPWSELLAPVIFPARAATIALGLLGVLAIMLAITGVFGMASYNVSTRMHELGIRSALGARSAQILRAALGRTAAILALGSLIGLLSGIAASRLLASIVYSASASDPLVLVAVVVTMALLGVASTLLPARRAVCVDPAILLREE